MSNKSKKLFNSSAYIYFICTLIENNAKIEKPANANQIFCLNDNRKSNEQDLRNN